MKAANPYLNFKGNTEEAFNFYRSVFGEEFEVLLRFRDFGDNEMGIAEKDLDKIAHVALRLGQSMLMGTDVVDSMPMTFTPGNNFYIALSPENADEADALFGKLAEGGTIEMPLQVTAWAEKYGSLVDKYGVQWMVSYEGAVRFGGAQPA